MCQTNRYNQCTASLRLTLYAGRGGGGRGLQMEEEGERGGIATNYMAK